jgi:hypothetical protein
MGCIVLEYVGEIIRQNVHKERGEEEEGEESG